MQNDAAFAVAPHALELEQAYKAIRTTPPEPKDLEQSQKLQLFMDQHFPTENDENITRRALILADLRTIFRAWVQQVCLARGVPEDVASEAGGQILVSGSYRLGVNEPGADIDTICVAPRHVTREDFFSTLKDIFLKHPKVTNLVAIEGAVVPIITFDYEDINIDLQIAILPTNTISETLNILDDGILANVDPATEKSLNGPRVTELMIKLTPNRDSFISVLRIVRRWAKCRGLYSNKMGYLGGVNWCILVCFINQLYPTAAPSTLLLRFFMVLSTWKWPHAIQLCKNHDAKLGLEVWNANVGNNRYQVMPILTPAYPSMNSSFNVSTHSLAVMKEEFKRGLEVVQNILSKGGEDWDELFAPSDFFAVQQHYLAIDVYTTNEEEEHAWCGFCESRLRKLIDSLAYYNPQLCRLRAFPKKFPMSFSPDTMTNAEGKPTKFGVGYYVGFDVDRTKLMGRQVSIDTSVSSFVQNDLYRWNKKTPTMDVSITPMQWKNLPEAVFEELGGRAKARDLRREHMRKKKEEAALAAAAEQPSGTLTDDSMSFSQEMDGCSTGDEGGDNSVSGRVSPDPTTDGEQAPSTGTEEANAADDTKVVNPSDDMTSKRKRDDSVGDDPRSVSGVTTKTSSAPAVASTASAANTPPTVSNSSTPVKAGRAVEPQQALPPRTLAPAAPASAPRKRRKMKISFGNLG